MKNRIEEHTVCLDAFLTSTSGAGTTMEDSGEGTYGKYSG